MSSASCVSLLLVILSLVVAPAAPRHSLPSVSVLRQSPDEVALRSHTEACYRYWAAKDLDGFTRLWTPKSPDFEARKKSMLKFAADYGQIELKSVVVQKVAVVGEKARVRVDV